MGGGSFLWRKSFNLCPAKLPPGQCLCFPTQGNPGKGNWRKGFPGEKTLGSKRLEMFCWFLFAHSVPDLLLSWESGAKQGAKKGASFCAQLWSPWKLGFQGCDCISTEGWKKLISVSRFSQSWANSQRIVVKKKKKRKNQIKIVSTGAPGINPSSTKGSHFWEPD